MSLKHDASDPANIGRFCRWGGRDWKIVGINYLGDYDLERFEQREDGRWKVGGSCVLGLPMDHPHFAFIYPEPYMRNDSGHELK